MSDVAFPAPHELVEAGLAASGTDECLVLVREHSRANVRFAVNRACMAARKPLVSGAAIRYTGQVAIFDPRDPASPCYACLYDEGLEELGNCRQNGVLAPLTGVIGSLMAVETLKLLTGSGRPLLNRLLRFDAASGELHATRLEKDPACPVCSRP